MPTDTAMTADFSCKLQTANFAARIEALVDELCTTKKEVKGRRCPSA